MPSQNCCLHLEAYGSWAWTSCHCFMEPEVLTHAGPVSETEIKWSASTCFQSCLILFHFVPINLPHARYPNPHRCTCGMFWICSGSGCLMFVASSVWDFQRLATPTIVVAVSNWFPRLAGVQMSFARKLCEGCRPWDWSIHELQLRSTARSLAGWRKTAAGRRKGFSGTLACGSGLQAHGTPSLGVVWCLRGPGWRA